MNTEFTSLMDPHVHQAVTDLHAAYAAAGAPLGPMVISFDFEFPEQEPEGGCGECAFCTEKLESIEHVDQLLDQELTRLGKDLHAWKEDYLETLVQIRDLATASELDQFLLSAVMLARVDKFGATMKDVFDA